MPLFHQQHGAAALNFAGDFTVQMGRHASDAAGKNFTALGDEFLEQIGIFIIDGFEGDVDAAARHGAVGAPKSGTTFGGLGLHWGLFSFAMESMSSQERIVFFLLETIGRTRAFLVSRGHIARNWFAQSFRLGALESHDFLSHKIDNFSRDA